MPEEWRLIRTGPLSGAMNMALDEILFDAVAGGRSRPVLRLYRWSPPTLSLSYAQSLAEVNLDACRRFGLDVVRRATGGRAVLHDQECTYAIIARSGALIPATITASCRMFGGVLQKTMVRLGLAADLAGRRRSGSQPGICFTAPGQDELVYLGRKLTGSSQKRRGGSVLQHGSIPVELDLEKLWQILDPSGSAPAAGAAQLAERVGWLNRFLVAPVTIDAVEEALVGVFTQELAVHFLPEKLTGEEWEAATRLADKKYANKEWTRYGGKAHPNGTPNQSP
jgi:lipoate-protein ligase A